MTKEELTSFVRVAILQSEAVADNQRVANFPRVKQACNYAFDTIISQIPLTESGKAEIEAYYVKHYYNQDVKASGGYRYVGISDAILPIGNGKGVWYVQPSGGGEPFARTARPRRSLFANLAIGDVMNETTWRVGNVSTNVQIVLENIGDSQLTDIRKIDYGVVRSLASYGDTEEVRVPNLDILIRMAVTWFGNTFNNNVNDNK